MTVLPLNDDDPARIGPYEIEGRLSSPAGGAAYLGRSRDGLPAAISTPATADPGAVPGAERLSFRDRVDTARQVSGAWGVTVLGAEPDGTPPWLATTFLDGPTLADVVHDEGPLTIRAVRELAATVAERLSAVHAHGFAHDRLGPSDIVLTDDGPRLADLGLACARGAATPAGDVRALGALLLFACTGRDGSDDAAGGQEAEGRPEPAERPDLAGVPDELIGLIAACLAADPAGRPTTEEVIARTGDDTPRVPAPAGTGPGVAGQMSLAAAVAWMLGGAVACLALIGGVVAVGAVTAKEPQGARAATPPPVPSPSALPAHEVTFELEATGPDMGKAPVTVRYEGSLGGGDQISSFDLGALDLSDLSDSTEAADPAENLMTAVEVPWEKTFTLHGPLDSDDTAARPSLQLFAMIEAYDKASGTYLPHDVVLTCRILVDGEVVDERRGGPFTAPSCQFYANAGQQERYEKRMAAAEKKGEATDELLEKLGQGDLGAGELDELLEDMGYDPDELDRMREE